jgi:hypothetical protein
VPLIIPPTQQLPPPAPPSQTTVRQVCTNALYEINVVAPGEVPDFTSELSFALDKFNQIADSWSAQKVFIYAVDLISAAPPPPVGNSAPFILSPGLAPHTIGPLTSGAPTFQVITERPVRIKNINVLLNNVFPIVRYPLTKRDSDWWATQRVQGITTSLPTDFYYRPDWPLGSIFFWPVPNYAYGVEIEVETVIQGGVNLDIEFTEPPGYELAMTLTIAELLCPAFEKQPNPVLIAAAMKARNAIIGVNNAAPRINLDDFGPSGSTRPRATWNYHTGMSR